MSDAQLSIFFDCDFTLTGIHGGLRPYVREVFERLNTEGHHVYIWSGVRVASPDLRKTYFPLSQSSLEATSSAIATCSAASQATKAVYGQMRFDLRECATAAAWSLRAHARFLCCRCHQRNGAALPTVRRSNESSTEL